MGTSSTKTFAKLSSDVYTTTLSHKNNKVTARCKRNVNQFSDELYVLDILMELLSHCDRADACRVLHVLFTPLKQNQSVLSALLDQFKPDKTIDSRSIIDFNKNNRILRRIDVASTNAYRLCFTQIAIDGSDRNIRYLITNKASNIMYSFLYFLSVRYPQIFKPNATQICVSIDAFVKSHKKQSKGATLFDTQNIFCFSEDKLENIKTNSSYCFETFRRIAVNDALVNELHTIGWKKFNDIFLKYLLTNQLNYCLDKSEKKWICKGVERAMDLKDDRLSMFMGLVFAGSALKVYNMNWCSTKNRFILGATDNQTYKKGKKVHRDTQKVSAMFVWDGSGKRFNVLFMMNRTSEDHIKEKVKVGKKITNAMVDSWARSGF